MLPDTPAPIANYVPGVRVGKLLYLSGLGPAPRADGKEYLGKMDADLTLEEGYDAARLVGINLISRIKGENRRSGQGEAHRQAALDGGLDPDLYRSARGGQWLLRPPGRGVWRQGTPRPIRGWHVGVAGQYSGGNRDDRRGRRLIIPIARVLSSGRLGLNPSISVPITTPTGLKVMSDVQKKVLYLSPRFKIMQVGISP